MAITRTLMVALLCLIAVGMGLMGSTQATAQEEASVSATRSITPSSVPASGGEVTVTVNIAGPYGVGSVVETLPAGGFEYVAGSVVPSDIAPTVSGRGVTFNLLGESSFTYGVTVSAAPGQHTFSGALTYGLDKTVAEIGETPVTVDAAPSTTVSATRSITPSSVPASGGEVTVTVNIAGPYGVGSVVETLPAGGVEYVAGSVVPSDIAPMVSGRGVTFNLLGESSFTYGVTVSAAPGQHTFSGALTYGLDKTVAEIGETPVTVDAAPSTTVSATRSITPSSVPASGGEVTVTVNIAGPYGVGSVVETLPTGGFEYVAGSVVPSDTAPTVSGRGVTFNLLGESSFTYGVTVSAAPGQHTFSGALTYGLDKTVAQIGATRVTVRAPQPVAPTQQPVAPTPQPVNRPPVFRSVAAVSVAENTTTVVRVRATDSDSRDTVTGYAIGGGADSGKFSIVAATGELSFTTAPDFENPADAGANNEYVVAVRATSGAGGRARTATRTITVTVVNVDEMGTVTLSSTAPQVGAAIIASVTDPDGVVTGETWQWARSADGSTGWADTGATSAAYTPVQADEDNYLRATASYTDGEGSGKSAEAVSDNAVPAVSAGVPGDTNNDGMIDKPEVIAAFRAYIGGDIDKPEIIEIFRQYVADAASSQ